jgi:HemY protein
MIRVVFYFVLVTLIAIGGAWLADRPGDVVITWLGWRIDISLMVAAAAMALVAILAVALWSLTRLVWRSPHLVRRAMAERRRARAHRAISHGLIAIGAGDVRAARTCAEEAGRLAPHEPLTLLLNAQMAQMAGDRAGAEQAFRAMAHRGDTKLLGIRGLYVEAHRRDDGTAARHYAEQAAAAAPALAWAGQAVLDDRCAAADWAGALAALERMQQSGVTDKASYRRKRAVLITARALSLADSDAAAAKASALEALKLAPDLVPAAALAGRLAAADGELRRAAKILETAWSAVPHPDLAEVYAHLRSGDTARDRLARVETLARQPSGHPEGRLAKARAAIDAREFATAREQLGTLLAVPTQRVALLMAELEEVEHGDVGRAREWMMRALHAAHDPAWVADGFISDHWLPVSPVTGALDAFQWKTPDITTPRLIEPRQGNIDAPAASPSAGPGEKADEIDDVSPDAVVPEPSSATRVPVSASPVPATPVSATPGGRPSIVPAVIPLVRAPDDPGPPEPSRAAGGRRRRLFFW